MKNIRILLSENFHFTGMKVSVYLNKHVFVMGDFDQTARMRKLIQTLLGAHVRRYFFSRVANMIIELRTLSLGSFGNIGQKTAKL